MYVLKKYYQIFLLFVFFLLVPITLALIMPPDPDMYFDIQLGNIIAHHGIIYHEVLSQAGSNRRMLPDEWLFQLIIYWFTKIFGFSSWRIFIEILITVQLAIFYRLLRRIFNVNIIFSLCLLLFYSLLVYDFFAPRANIMASTFFIAELYILLLYVLKNKNYLYILLPITYLWANVHPSVVLSPVFCIAYFVICVIFSYLNKKDEAEWLKKAKVLSLYSLGVSIVSILPPLSFIPYQYLLLFVQRRDLVTHLIIEWKPLYTSMDDFILYSCVIIITLIIFLFVILRKNLATNLIWIIPFILLILYGYTALRNTYYGYFATTILLGWLFSQLNFHRLLPLFKIILYVCIASIFLIEIWLIQVRLQSVFNTFPVHAADFIQREHMKGNMFNQLVDGGYLGYRLYPEQKVFIDARLDVFLCCEIPDYVTLINNLTDSTSDNSILFNKFLNKYGISYVVLVMKNDTLASNLSTVLLNAPQWSLVYWDNTSEIFVKNDGKNADILNQFSAKAATPFGNTPFRKGQMNEAYADYAHMTTIQDSALSRDAMGFILTQQGNLHQAGDQFIKATQLDPTDTLAFFGMAQLMMKAGQPLAAINLYKRAITLDPNQIVFYVLLGQAYKSASESTNAKDIWSQGYKQATNENDKKVFMNLINSL